MVFLLQIHSTHAVQSAMHQQWTVVEGEGECKESFAYYRLLPATFPRGAEQLQCDSAAAGVRPE